MVDLAGYMFFINAPSTTTTYTLSLHDALPISLLARHGSWSAGDLHLRRARSPVGGFLGRSEEHTSELQSRLHIVCRLLLEKKTTTGCAATAPLKVDMNGRSVCGCQTTNNVTLR